MDGRDSSRNLTDAELAQLMAFEEAGIPAELAFEIDQSSTPVEDDTWIDCDCGERVLLQEHDLHMRMHRYEDPEPEPESKEDPPVQYEPDFYARPFTNPPPDASSDKQRKASSQHRLFPLFDKSNWKKQSNGNQMAKSGVRLGKSELGPYAYETQMPDRIRSLLLSTKATLHDLKYDGVELHVNILENETPNLIPILKTLSEADKSIPEGGSLFCHPGVHHVGKLPREGGFCGYRNIQMLISYIRSCKNAPGHDQFSGRLPSIFKLQEMIESAWSHGYNSNAKLETGGIRGTRKYIGTPEAHAFFSSLGIPCKSEALSTRGDRRAVDALVSRLHQHFEKPNSPPVYLQHKGHSLTVVGWEKESDRGRLIIFDPMFQVSKSLKSLARRGGGYINDASLIKAHRYGRNHFRRYDEFELLFLERSA